MNRIVLKDGTKLNIEIGATTNCIAIVTDDLAIINDYANALTEENLSYAVVVDEYDSPIMTLKDKYLSGFDGTRVVGSEKSIVCFRLDNVYTIEEKIAMLEDENAKLRASQEIQDEAIVELAGIIAE